METFKKDGDLKGQLLRMVKPRKVDFHDVHAHEVPTLFPEVVAEHLEYFSEIGESDPERRGEMGVLRESKIEVPGEVVETFSPPGESCLDARNGVIERGDQEMVFLDNPFGQEVTEKVPPVHGIGVLLVREDI